MSLTKLNRLFLAFLFAASLLPASPASALILKNPQTKVDALREAIEAANANPGYDKIVLSHDLYTVDSEFLDSGDAFPEITSDVELFSESGAVIELDDEELQVRFFTVSGRGTLRLTGVTLRKGFSSGSGGAIKNYGQVVLKRAEFKENTASSGGAIWSNGSVHGTDCEFWENEADFSDGGAVLNAGNAVFHRTVFHQNHANRKGGAVANAGYFLAVNSTFSTNTADNSGGGLANGGDLWLKNATVTLNTSDFDESGFGGGGGIASNPDSTHLLNTILAGNIDATPWPANEPDIAGEVRSRGYNIIGELGDGNLVGDVATCMVGVDPLLWPRVQINDTWVHELQSASPAIDAGSPGYVADMLACEEVDQTGYGRPADGNGDGSVRCDIGAYEARGWKPPTDVDGYKAEDDDPEPPQRIPGGKTTHDPTHGGRDPQGDGGVIVTFGTEEFLRGDANTDGTVDVADASRVMAWLFLGDDAPSCKRTADANGDDEVTIADVTRLLNFLFLGGSAPVAPFPQCDTANASTLSCTSYDACPTALSKVPTRRSR